MGRFIEVKSIQELLDTPSIKKPVKLEIRGPNALSSFLFDVAPRLSLGLENPDVDDIVFCSPIKRRQVFLDHQKPIYARIQLVKRNGGIIQEMKVVKTTQEKMPSTLKLRNQSR